MMLRFTSSARLGWGLNILVTEDKGIGFRGREQESFRAGVGAAEHGPLEEGRAAEVAESFQGRRAALGGAGGLTPDPPLQRGRGARRGATGGRLSPHAVPTRCPHRKPAGGVSLRVPGLVLRGHWGTKA